ncbi:MAG: hypothetical protein H6622_11890 [Halobacteriovoraceae bacterium]|nr:hypothetical protein [Halobacteriovoraceae bacterium]
MQNIIRIFLICIVLFTTKNTFAQWNAKDILPPITVIGEGSESNDRHFKNIYKKMETTINHWKQRGLAKPEKLEGIYAISSYENISLIQFLQILNPTIPDIKAHIEKQYSDLDETQLMDIIKHVVAILNKKNKKGKHKKHILEFSKFTQKVIEKYKVENDVDLQRIKDSIFDLYAMFRYGHSVNNFHEAIQQDLSMKEIIENNKSEFPNFDNAYYGKFYKLDLLDILYKKSEIINYTSKDGFQSQSFRLSEIEPEQVFKMNSLMSSSQLLSHRLVLLPLRTQKSSDDDVNSFSDYTIADHEFAHHLNTSLSKGGLLNHQIDEVMADYLQAVPHGNPIVGREFAQASDYILDRLSFSSKETPFQILHNYDKLASKGYLRNLQKEVTFNDLNRKFLMTNNYEGGDPLRYMLWELRHFGELNQEQKDAFDGIILKANTTFSKLPLVIPHSTSIILAIRDSFIQFKIYLRAMEIEKESKLVDKERKNSKVPLRPVNFETAKIMAIQEFEKKESDWKKNKKKYFKKYRLFNRKSIAADYINSEYIRVLYREAQKASRPDLAKKIREFSEIITNSKALKINFLGDENELIFSRSFLSRLNPLTRIHLRKTVKKLKKLSKKINELKLKDSLSLKERGKLEKLFKIYSLNLSKIGEFERTGSSFSLFFPHAFSRAMLLLGKTTSLAFKLAIFPFQMLRSHFSREFIWDKVDKVVKYKETSKYFIPLPNEYNQEDIDLRIKFNEMENKASRKHAINIPNLLKTDSTKIEQFIKDKSLESNIGEYTAFTLYGKASSTSLFLITQRNTNNEIDIYIEQAQNDIWMDVVLNIFAFNQNRSFIVPRLSNELAHITNAFKVDHRKKTKTERIVSFCQMILMGRRSI